MDTGKIFLGLLAGVAIGATLGILFAPDKGSSTRKKITKKREEFVQGLEEKFNNAIDSITEQYETLKDDVSGMAEKADNKAEGFIKDQGVKT